MRIRDSFRHLWLRVLSLPILIVILFFRSVERRWDRNSYHTTVSSCGRHRLSRKIRNLFDVGRWNGSYGAWSATDYATWSLRTGMVLRTDFTVAVRNRNRLFWQLWFWVFDVRCLPVDGCFFLGQCTCTESSALRVKMKSEMSLRTSIRYITIDVSGMKLSNLIKIMNSSDSFQIEVEWYLMTIT